MPGMRPSEEVRWADFATLDLPGCNTAPLGDAPFNLDCDLNMSGLPWGCTFAFGGVPFALQPAASAEDNAVICLAGGESARIPVEMAASSLNFLGQVVAYAGLEYDRLLGKYVLEFDDGSMEEVEWRNVRNCEAIGLEYVALAAPLAQAWAPHLFDAGSTTLVHINTLWVDTGGRVVRSVCFEAGDTDARPVLLAVTAEPAEAAPTVEPAARVRFDREDDRCSVEPADGFTSENGFIESRGDVTEGTIRIPVAEPGAYRVEAVLESTQPLLVDISDGKSTVVQGWQLLGEWPHRPIDPARRIRDLDTRGFNGTHPPHPCRTRDPLLPLRRGRRQFLEPGVGLRSPPGKMGHPPRGILAGDGYRSRRFARKPQGRRHRRRGLVPPAGKVAAGRRHREALRPQVADP